jgi:asparaginyl-tRNA synthetase
MESSVYIEGTIKEDKRSPSGVELVVSGFELITLAEEYPIQKKEHGIEFLMDHRHLWLRSSRQEAVLKIRHRLAKSVHAFFDENGFTRVDSPILTPTSAEGTSTLFETDYFGEPAYLSQTGQLYAEASAAALGRVYVFGPTFRAEKSKTRRHVMEFWMIEPEVAFMTLDEDMVLAEDLITRMVGDTLADCRQELATLERDVAMLEKVKPPFPRITYQEALDILADAGLPVKWGEGFGGDEETAIAEAFDKPVIIHRYPFECKAFYMLEDPEDSRLTMSMDIIAPEGYGEIVGGSAREHDLERLMKRVDQHNLPHEPLKWYFDIRRYGGVPMAGFGMGFARTVMWICGLSHVREALPYPRLINRIYP